MSNKTRVVITGLGVVSSIGIGKDAFWKSLVAGKSGISKVESFDVSTYDRQYGGEVKNFNPREFISKRKIQNIGRASQFAIAAAKLALKDANLEESEKNVGVNVGTTVGELRLLEEFHDHLDSKQEKFNYAYFSAFPSASLASNIALELGLTGGIKVFTTACAAGNYALADGVELLRKGKLSYVLAGGSDGFSRVIFTGFNRLLAIAPEQCQPFDKNRKGMIPGEGAGMLLLETYENAKKRGTHIYAEVAGYGLSCDGHHMTNPSSVGVAKAIDKALKDAKVNSKQVDYFCAHGTGTSENDKAESGALHEIFGEKKNIPPVSSIKSMLGHTMGAASALESIACCLALENQAIPPTINFSEPDPECDIDCVPNKARESNLKCVLNNAQAFGGNNCCVVFIR